MDEEKSFSIILNNFIKYIQENKIDYATFKRLINIIDKHYIHTLCQQQSKTYLEISDGDKQWYKLKD